MVLLLLASSITIMLPVIVFITAWILSLRTLSDREKSSPFECGFDPKNIARIPFSMRFFLLAIIFIVFDIEIVLLTPIPLLLDNFKSFASILGASLFLLILIAGLLHEWREGSLEWSS